MRSRMLSVLFLLALLRTGFARQEPRPTPPPNSANCFISFTDFSRFERTESDAALVFISPVMAPTIDWNELVISWNVASPTREMTLRVEARALSAARQTPFYNLGVWSPDEPTRHSVVGQKDAYGEVETDTLILKRPAQRVQVRVTVEGRSKGDVSPLKFLGLSLANTLSKAVALPPNRAAWGRVIPVPERSQVSYQGGSVWCSPTSVSMVLAHWAKTRNRPEWDVEVPEVARGVHDRNWPGTGNWPFNTAFAGSLPGLRAYVTRFDDVSELEDWIASGFPVVLSVSYPVLKGRIGNPGGGHLVVCVGFTENGDVEVNDPWAVLTKGERVRKIFPRPNLVKAWRHSHNAVYLIYPQSAKIPVDRLGHWERY